MLALLNDGAILSIAYDNVHYSNKPEAWNMRLVMSIATVISIVGVIDSFGLFYLCERYFHLDRAIIQTLMYLKLSVAGHFKIFITRTRGPFWSHRPARILLFAVFGTQALATIIAIFGFLMPPIGWGWALLVWGYSLPFFLMNDRIKLLAYRILDPIKAAPEPKIQMEQKPMSNTKSKPEVKANVKAVPEAKAVTKTKPQSETDAAPEPEDKTETSANLTPQLVKRVHQLYEELGRDEVQAVNDMEQAVQKSKVSQ